MAEVNVSTRTIQRGNFDHPYSEDCFVNPESYDASDSRMNRAWVIHNAGYVQAIVFAEYYAYSEQDALDEAADSGKLDYLQVSESELADYEIGKDSEGYPEYEGIINLGNASEPFDSQSLDYFEVPANIFALDSVIMRVVERQSREQALDALHEACHPAVSPARQDQLGRQTV
jgi:hypothetical protein